MTKLIDIQESKKTQTQCIKNKKTARNTQNKPKKRMLKTTKARYMKLKNKNVKFLN